MGRISGTVEPWFWAKHVSASGGLLLVVCEAVRKRDDSRHDGVDDVT